MRARHWRGDIRSGGDDFRFAFGRCKDQAAAHAVATEDPSGGAAGEEQFFCVDDPDEAPLLVADDDAGTARIGDTRQEVVGQGGGVLAIQRVCREAADGWREAVEFVLGFDQCGLEEGDFHKRSGSSGHTVTEPPERGKFLRTEPVTSAQL